MDKNIISSQGLNSSLADTRSDLVRKAKAILTEFKKFEAHNRDKITTYTNGKVIIETINKKDDSPLVEYYKLNSNTSDGEKLKVREPIKEIEFGTE